MDLWAGHVAIRSTLQYACSWRQTESELGQQTGSEMAPCSREAPPCKQYEFLGNVQKARLSGKDAAHIPDAPTQARVPALHGYPSPQLSSPWELNDNPPLVDSSFQRSRATHSPPEAAQAVYLRSQQGHLERSPRTVGKQSSLLLALSI